MDYIENAVMSLRKKFSERIKRAEIVSEGADGIGQDEGLKLIESKKLEIMSWSKEDILRKLVDDEEILLMALLNRI